MKRWIDRQPTCIDIANYCLKYCGCNFHTTKKLKAPISYWKLHQVLTGHGNTPWYMHTPGFGRSTICCHRGSTLQIHLRCLVRFLMKFMLHCSPSLLHLDHPRPIQPVVAALAGREPEHCTIITIHKSQTCTFTTYHIQ